MYAFEGAFVQRRGLVEAAALHVLLRRGHFVDHRGGRFERLEPAVQFLRRIDAAGEILREAVRGTVLARPGKHLHEVVHHAPQHRGGQDDEGPPTGAPGPEDVDDEEGLDEDGQRDDDGHGGNSREVTPSRQNLCRCLRLSAIIRARPAAPYR